MPASGVYKQNEHEEPLKGACLEHDPTWAGVKTEGRAFRDLPFALLFVANLICVTAVAIWSFDKGELTGKSPQCPSVSDTKDYYGRAIVYLQQNSHLLWVSAAVAFGFGAVWLVLLRAFTAIAIWVTLAAAVSTVVAGGAYLVSFSNSDVKIAGYVLFGVAAILVLLIIYLRKKIQLTAAIMAEACKGLQRNPVTFGLAFATLAVIGGFLAMWIASLVYLNCVPSSASVHSTRYTFLYLVFGGCWIIFFLLAALQVSIAGGIATWYFSRTQYVNETPLSPSVTAYGWALSTSFGSIAFGSAVLAVIALIRFVLYRAQKATEGNKLASCIVSCMRCACACLFGLVQQLNEFAYIYMAMYGTSFIESAKKVFQLIGRNTVSTIMVDSLSNMVLLFGRILGTLLSVITVAQILKIKFHGLHNPLDSAQWLLVLTALVAWVILSVFSSIISVAVDTVFVCYCEDLERNRESGRYLMDPSLHSMLQGEVSKKNAKA